MVDVDVTSGISLKDSVSTHWFSDYWNQLFDSVNNVSFEEVKIVVRTFLYYISSIVSGFDEFQIKILKIFSIILLINVVLILILWNIYKDQIYERFIRPGTYISK